MRTRKEKHHHHSFLAWNDLLKFSKDIWMTSIPHSLHTLRHAVFFVGHWTSYGWKAWKNGNESGASSSYHALTLSLWGTLWILFSLHFSLRNMNVIRRLLKIKTSLHSQGRKVNKLVKLFIGRHSLRISQVWS